jgi:LPXTG-motif cell wall-anchored protein
MALDLSAEISKTAYPTAKKGWYGTATATSSSYAGGGSGSYGGSSGGTLPATGGPAVPSALAFGAGALLVAGGLLARRLIR